MKEILRKLNSIKLTLMAHPDYALYDGGEFHDRVDTIEEIETELQNIDALHGVSVTPEQLREKAEKIYQETMDKGFSPKLEGDELSAVRTMNDCAKILEKLHSR